MTSTIQQNLVGTSSLGDGSPRPVQYLETVEAYDKWAEVYDTDGNFLQALDTIEMQTLLPAFLAHVQSTSRLAERPLKLIDLGCGTGRNTLQLQAAAPANAEIMGLDNSRGMLDVARKALDKNLKSNMTVPVTLETYDLLQSPPSPPSCALGASGVISTLVLEHIPVDTFFTGASALLAPGGYFLVTNMHSDMGAISQAGFVDVGTGTKIRPTSYSHTVEEVLRAADGAGFEVLEEDGLRERAVDERMVEVLGKRARKWVGIKVWFAVCFRKRGVE